MTVPFVDRDFHCIPNCKMAEQNGECLTRCLVKRAKPDSPVTAAMVDRFLSWKLPEDFHPDAGISFSPYFNVEWNAKHGKPPERHQPIGTNLLTATQARAMLEHVLACVQTEAAQPTELQVRVGALILAATPLIETPHLPHEAWMGLSRRILESALACTVSPHAKQSEPK